MVQITLRQKRLLTPIRQILLILLLVMKWEYRKHILPMAMLGRDPRAAQLMRKRYHMVYNAQSLGFRLWFGRRFILGFGAADAMEPIADSSEGTGVSDQFIK